MNGQVSRFLALTPPLSQKEKASKELASNHCSKIKLPKKIAVDLTPVLPDGMNGGAKILVLDLLCRLAELYPEIQFVLLTQSASHQELSCLDRPNMQRHMVVGRSINNNFQPFIKKIARIFLTLLPNGLNNLAAIVGYRINKAAKRFGSSNRLLHDINAELLFCPFSSSIYFEEGIPTVCTLYDTQFKEYPEFFSKADAIYREKVFYEAIKNANVLSTISDYSRYSIIKYSGINKDRIRTIYPRLTRRISINSINDENLFSKFGVVKNRYLIYPANFWKHKNHEMLFTAFGMAYRMGLESDIKLVCTGMPCKRQHFLKNAAKAMQLNGRIIFPGYINDADFAQLIKKSAGVVFPSLYEGFGLPVIEAMAAGVPVACSNNTSLPEIAGHAALYFDARVPNQIATTIISMVNDEILRRNLIEKGKKHAAMFSDIDRMAMEYIRLFQFALLNKK